MNPTDQLNAFANSVRLLVKNRYIDGITTTDGKLLVAQTVDWLNQLIDELEAETKPDGTPVDWSWVRQNGFTLGTASQGAASISLPTSVNNLITEPNRYVQVLQDGTAVSNWAVVHPSRISSKTDRITEDMCALVGGSIVFSRTFRDTEDNGTIVGDITTPLPRVTLNPQGNPTNVKILTTVKPKQLLILGVAKNATLPDIVQGGLSPSYVQKYNDMLSGVIAREVASSLSRSASYDDYGYIGGIY